MYKNKQEDNDGPISLTFEICIIIIEVWPKFTSLRFVYKFYVQGWNDGPIK